MMNKMDKKQLSEKILNHALGIIYLLTGEEYVVIKKNSPHGTSDIRTGKVPINCGDISIYFSMEEWDYIEQHWDLYKDVVVESHLSISAVRGSSNLSSDVKEEDLEGLSGAEDAENTEDVKPPILPTAMIIGEAGDYMQSVEQVEETLKKRVKEEQITDIKCEDFPSSTYGEVGDYMQSVEQVEETLKERVKEEEITDIKCEDLSTSTYVDHSVVRGTLEESHQAAWLKGETLQTSYVSQEEETSQTSHVSQEDETSQTSHVSQEEETSQTSNISPEEETSQTSHVSPEEETSQTSHVSPEEETSQTSHVSPEEETSQTSHISAEEETSQTSHVSPEEETSQTSHVSQDGETLQKSGVSQEFTNNVSNDPNEVVNLITNSVCDQYKPLSLGETLLPENSTSVENVHIVKRKSRKQDLQSKKDYLEYEPMSEDQLDESENDFSYKSCITLHQESSTPYIWSERGRCFISEPILPEHMKKHSVEKPHKCDECGKNFRYRSHLRSHQRKHTGVKPHKCDLCSKQFLYKAHLIRHRCV